MEQLDKIIKSQEIKEITQEESVPQKENNKEESKKGIKFKIPY